MTRARPTRAPRREAPPAGYRLATAEILYRMPDHPNLLQTCVWQGRDMAPRFPALHRFLRFGRRELDGPLHPVRIASISPARRPRLRHARFDTSLH